MPLIREYETIGTERGEDDPLGIYTLTPDRIRYLPEEKVARGARLRELYAMLGLRAAVSADGRLSLDVTVAGATNTKGVMPCDESSSPSTTSTRT